MAVVALGGCGGSSIAALEVASAMSLEAEVAIVAPRSIQRRAPHASGRAAPRADLTSALERLDRPCAGDPAHAIRERLERLHRRRPLDALHVHFLWPLLEWVLPLLDRLPAPLPALTAVAHGSDVVGEGSRIRLGLAATRAVERWVAPSRALAHQLEQADPRIKCEVIPNGVQLGRFSPEPAKRGCHQVVHLTNFRPWKQSQLALQVLSRLRQGGQPWTLRVLGDGPGASAFDHDARRRGLAPHVARSGVVEVDRRQLAGAGVCLITSRRESFGLAALEALACGVPVVAPRLAGLDATLGHGPGAIQVPRPEPAMLAEAVRAALEPGPGQADRRTAARARAEQFDIVRTAEAFLAPLAASGADRRH